MGHLTLSSPAFRDGEPIPEEYGYGSRNVNPPLRVTGIPAGTETFALIMDDPDAIEPAGKIWDHWVIWNISGARTEIPPDWDAATAVEGPNDYGERGYGGPNPPDGTHTYRFILYALDSRLDIPTETDADGLRVAVDGKVLDEDRLEGTYSP
jgi:Raf kinase inhibitor-like YbhB/YbcL family protein